MTSKEKEDKKTQTSKSSRMSADERRTAIIYSVRQVVVENQGDITSKELAAHAGISEGMIFKVFSSKEQIIFESTVSLMVDSLLDEEIFAQLENADKTAPIEDRLEFFITTSVRQVEHIFSVMTTLKRIHSQQGRINSSEHKKAFDRIHEVFTTRREKLTDIFKQTVAQDSERLNMSPEKVLLLLDSIIAGGKFKQSVNLTDLNAKEIAHVLVHGIINNKQEETS